MCDGIGETGITPIRDTWYRFRFQAYPAGDGTRLRAKVWADGRDEPTSWQADCLTDGAEGFGAGRVGVWGMSRGRKLWDDLVVRPIGR